MAFSTLFESDFDETEKGWRSTYYDGHLGGAVAATWASFVAHLVRRRQTVVWGENVT
jgi:hypothetical protein